MDPVDGVIIFVPKIIIKKADCGTLIQKLWQTNLHGGKTATPPGGFILNVDSYVLLVGATSKLDQVIERKSHHLRILELSGTKCFNFKINALPVTPTFL